MHRRLLFGLAGGLIVLSIITALSVAFAIDHPPTTTTTTSSGSICGLLTSSDVDWLASNGAGREVSGLNQSAPPWDYLSIKEHIQQGWDSLCQTSAFITAIQVHGTQSFSIGGGGIDAANPDSSQAAIAVAWTQGTLTSANCTQDIETWGIFIVNGTLATPSTLSTICTSD